MPDQPFQILFVEDLPSDVEIAERVLMKSGLKFRSTRVETEASMLEAYGTQRPDIIISDYSMPLFNGMAALLLAKKLDPYMPVIILTGSMGEDTAVACLKAGANDYVIKEHLSRLPFAIQEALEHSALLKRRDEQDELLRQNEERYRSIFSDSNVVMLIIDPEYGTITDANNAATEYYGWPMQELVGKKISDINTLSTTELKVRLRVAAHNERSHFEFQHRHADGSITEVEVHSSPVSIGDRLYLFSIIHDISLRIAAEHERDSLTKKLSHYLATSPTITYAIRLEDGTVHQIWTSENVQSILGYSVTETLQPDWWFGNIVASDRSVAIGAITELTSHERFIQDYRFHRKDRSIVWIRDEMRILRTADGSSEIIGTMTDVTEQKTSEAEIALKSAALEASDNAVVITNREGIIEWANIAFQTLTGYSSAEAVGRNPRELVKSGKQDPAMYKELWDTILSGKSWSGNILNKKKSGELYHEKMTITPVLDTAGRIAHFIAIKNDISEEIHSKELIESSLREKEVLLREIHHRVKNNMQIITSLLNLSSENLTDPQGIIVLKELNRRIGAMAIVHEQFYDARDASCINFSIYIRQLVDSLIADIATAERQPKPQYNLENLMLNLETAIPAGLILSEFVSNALQSAVASSGNKTSIHITLRQETGDLVLLEVQDGRQAIPEKTDPTLDATLGSQLIKILAEQLHGTFRLTSGDDTTAVLRFPCMQSGKQHAKL